MTFTRTILAGKFQFLLLLLMFSLQGIGNDAPVFCTCDDALPRDLYITCLIEQGCREEIPVNDALPLLICGGFLLLLGIGSYKELMLKKKLQAKEVVGASNQQ